MNFFLVSQCNPYLLPIISTKGILPGTIGVLFEQEFKHRCQQLMEIMPRRLGISRLLKLLSQPWEGDITMVLPVTTFSTLKAVINLSRNDVLLALAEGQRATWAKLPAITTSCDIEFALDECLRHVSSLTTKQRRLKHGRMTSKAGDLPRSIPSWIHLHSVGIPHANSYEMMEATGQPEWHMRREKSVVSSTDFGHQNSLMQPTETENVNHPTNGQATTTGDAGSSSELYSNSDEHSKKVITTAKNSQDVWKQLFEVAPASIALDIIAP